MKTPVQAWGLQLYEKETPTQVFSRDLCEIFKNTFYKEHFQETASQTYFENVWSSGSEVLYKKEFLKI